MSEDEADPELLQLLRQRLGLGPKSSTAPPDTKVLEHARFIYDNSIDVAVDMRSTQAAAEFIWKKMALKEYSTANWSQHELHPKAKDESTVNFIFTMDLLNFSFWSEKGPGDRFAIEWQGKKWTGYWSLIAALQRALHEGIPITDPSFWASKGPVADEDSPEIQPLQEVLQAPAELSDAEHPKVELEAAPLNGENGPERPQSKQNGVLQMQEVSVDSEEPEDLTQVSTGDVESQSNERFEVKSPPVLSLEILRHVFRSSTTEEIPLLQERFQCLQEAGNILQQEFDGRVTNLISRANCSAAGLVNLLATSFPIFCDEARFERKRVRFLKRAQIMVADLWAAFDGKHYGTFDDIDQITIFADYRIPQALQGLGCMWYSPPLESQIKNQRLIEPGSSWEVQIRGCSIWTIELIRREILSKHPGAKVNAILIDFFLYDSIQEFEDRNDGIMPHHRTRSIWY